jgi:hypothetical protein
MRRLIGIGRILTVMLVAIGGGFLGESEDTYQSVIEVSCPDVEGCFTLLGEAIRQASAGATIRVAPGTYYEKTLTIDKSLKVEGVSAETGRYPRIVLVDIGTAVLIRAGSPMTVELQDLSIVALARDPLSEEESLGIKIGVEGQPSEDLKVVLREVDIRSYTGIMIRGARGSGFTIEVESSTISGATGIVMSMEGRFFLRDSALYGPWEYAGDHWREQSSIGLTGIGVESAPGDVSIDLIDNRISGFTVGIAASTSTAFGFGNINVRLVANAISANRQYGIYLGGDGITAELARNEIISNGGYGIILVLPVCVSNVPPELQFQGVIRGVDNILSNNGDGDLCPLNYPWPEGFTKP